MFVLRASLNALMVDHARLGCVVVGSSHRVVMSGIASNSSSSNSQPPRVSLYLCTPAPEHRILSGTGVSTFAASACRGWGSSVPFWSSQFVVSSRICAIDDAESYMSRDLERQEASWDHEQVFVPLSILNSI